MLIMLERYIGKTILKMIFYTLILLLSLSGLIRFIEQLKKVSEFYNTLSIAFYTLLMVPKDIELYFSISCLLGSIIGLGLLASHSELVVMESVGFSRLKIIFSVIKTAFPLILFVMALGEWGAPYCEQIARNYRSEKLYGGNLLATEGSIWAKDNNFFVNIGKINSENDISDVLIYETTNLGKLLSTTYANSAIYKDNYWHLNQVEKTIFTQNDHIEFKKFLFSTWKSNITPDKLSVVAQRSDSLSTSGLYNYTKYLINAGLDAKNYELLFWQKIFKPLSVAVMMLLALGSIFGPLRNASMSKRVITGTLLGFTFYVGDNFISKLALVIGVPAFLSALITSVVIFFISLTLLRQKN